MKLTEEIMKSIRKKIYQPQIYMIQNLQRVTRHLSMGITDRTGINDRVAKLDISTKIHQIYKYSGMCDNYNK